MALFHIRSKLIQRTKGKKVISAAAYRRATKLFDARTNQYFDYSKKKGVIHSELLIPADSPSWIKALVELHKSDQNSAAELLWNKVEASEKRVDAQLARDIEFALPVELNQEQCLDLARHFINDVFVQHGMVADFSIHWDDGNPHVHVLLTTRELTADGFGKKVRAWNDRQLIQNACFKLAEITNHHLYQHGHDVKIDHRSYKERGIALIPSIHQGKAVTDMDRRGIATEVKANADKIRQDNLHKIANEPEVLLYKMHSEQSAFTDQKLVSELGRYITDKDGFVSFEHSDKNDLAAIHADKLLKKIDSEDKKSSQNVLTPQVILEILKKVEYHESVFTENDFAKILNTYTDNAQTFARALIELKSHSSLIHLGVGEDGRDRYTTRYMFDLENKTLNLASELAQAKHFHTHKNSLLKAIHSYEKHTSKMLSDEQIKAVEHLLHPNKLTCLIGRAGTGKSFTLGAAKHIWEEKGINVHGIALSGIAASNLSLSSGIKSRTIESFLYAYKEQKLAINQNDVVIMDEAGMTDVESMNKVLNVVSESKAKLVLVGDPQQLQPIGPGATFRGILEQSGFVEIQYIYRQEQEWQRVATTQLAAGNVTEAITAYDKNHCIHFADNDELAFSMLVSDWHETLNKKNDLGNLNKTSEMLVLAHRNEDVITLNQLIRASRLHHGEIHDGYPTQSANGQINLSKGDRLLFTKNDRQLGIHNGQFATITNIELSESGKIIKVYASLDDSQKEVLIHPDKYAHFTHGYAATIHKSQGVTIDHSLIYLGGFGWDKHLAYVAMSRHRKSCHLYTSHTRHKHVESVVKSLNKHALKDSLMDYPLSFSQRRNISFTDSKNKTFIKHLSHRFKQMVENLKDNYEQTFFPERYWANKEAEASRLQEIDDTLQRRNDAKLVLKYVEANKSCIASWKIIQESFSKLGMNPSQYDDETQALLYQMPEFRNYLDSVAKRNEIASNIYKESGRYTKALEIYQITRSTLSGQAKDHECRLRILSYKNFDDNQQFVLRDRIASTISDDIKIHYRQLKEMQIDTNILRQHARLHERRVLLHQLSTDERTYFRIVEEYRALNQRVGKVNKAFFDAYENNKSLSHAEIEHQQTLSKKRDELAFQIMNNVDSCSKALDFYQIGNIQKPNDVNQNTYLKYAQNRWFKLQEQAARHTISNRIKEYRQAVFTNDIPSRKRLAFEITQDDIQIKAHHFAIRSQTALPSDVWRTIRDDAKAYQRDVFYSGLTKEQRIDFKIVESYVNERRSVARSWQEIFSAKENQQLSNEIIFEKLQPFVKASQHNRDKLSALILNEPDRFDAHLKFFGIELESLKKSAMAHECRDRVLFFKQSQSVLEKATIAEQILEYPKEHFPAMKENEVHWKALYRFADINKQKRWFATLSPSEKKLQRLFQKYQSINRNAGKNWSKVFKAKEAGHVLSPKVQFMAEMLSAKRDAMAAKIIDLKESLSYMQLFEENELTLNTTNSLNNDILELNKNYQPKKIEQHAQKHLDRLSIVHEWTDYKERSLTLLKNFLNPSQSDENKNKSLNKYFDWLGFQSEANEINKIIKKHPAFYQVALSESHESIDSFERFLHLTSKITDKVKDYINVTTIKQEQEKQALGINMASLSEEELIKINKVKRILSQTKPITGTIAENYLRTHRGITAKLPSSLRFHPGYYNVELKQKLPALISVAKSERNEVQSLQITFLNPDSYKKAEVNITKMTHGIRNGSAVLINKGNNGKLIAIAEGVETALSIKEAKPGWTIYATLGISNFAHIPLSQETSQVIFCADNDNKIQVMRQLDNAADKLSKKGVDVWMVMPDKVKMDFNDVLLKEGLEAVKSKLSDISLYKVKQSIDTIQKDITLNTALLVSKNETIDQSFSLNDLLTKYIEMNIKQDQLTHAMHLSYDLSYEEKTKASQTAHEHFDEMKSLANAIYKRQDYQEILTETKNQLIRSKIGDRGGYDVLYQRLITQQQDDTDSQAIALDILKHTKSESWKQSQEQSQKQGRSKKR